MVQVGDLVSFSNMDHTKFAMFLVLSPYEGGSDPSLDDWDWELLDLNRGDACFAYDNELFIVRENDSR